jgi:hypothetical protein
MLLCVRLEARVRQDPTDNLQNYIHEQSGVSPRDRFRITTTTTTVIGQQSLIQRTNPQKYRVTIAVTIKNTGVNLNMIVIALPYAQTDPYQDVANYQLNGAEIIDIPGSDDKFVRFTVTGSALPARGQSKTYSYTFDVTLYQVDFQFNRLGTLYPYDQSSTVYQYYTGASGVYVDPTEARIKRIGDDLWAHSTNVIDYAYKCYQYVATHYRYLNPNTGIHPLVELLNQGGGDCGNLSSIFVSLLRYKNIPARHLVSMRPDANGHAWADFYLEGYGWVPVDVTYLNGNPGGNFFGRIGHDSNGVILSRELELPLAIKSDYNYTAALMQTYAWFYWGSGSGIDASYKLTSTRL